MDARFALYEDFNAEGQAMPVMAPGDEVSIASASHSANNTDSFRFAFERKFCNILGLSYARFSNDYSKTSFASIRAEFIDSWRMTFADRFQFCGSVPSAVALAFLEELIVTERILLPPEAPDFYENMTEYAQCEWRGPGMGWVDPVKDVNGAGLRIISGLSSPQAEAAAQGSDFYDNVAATARAEAYAKRKGVDLKFGPSGAATEEPDPADAAAAAEAAANPNDVPPAAPAPAPAPEKVN
jgi:capsid protein